MTTEFDTNNSQVKIIKAKCSSKMQLAFAFAIIFEAINEPEIQHEIQIKSTVVLKIKKKKSISIL